MPAMRLLDRYARWLVRHAWFVLAVIAGITAVVASGMRHLRTEFSVEASLPANHPFVQIDRTIRKQFGGRRTLMLAVVPKTGDVWQPEVLSTVRDLTLAGLRLDDVIAQNVISLAAPSVRHVEDRGGAIVTDYLMRDVPQTPEEMAALRERVESDPQLRGMLVTPDQRAALVVLDFWEGPESYEIAQRVLAMMDEFRDRPVDIYAAGEPMLALSDLGQSAVMGRRIPLVFVVISLMLLVSFRNLQGMFIPMLTAILSTVWALGLMGHTGIVIDTWNVAVPILLVAIAAAHSAQMLKRYVEEVARTGDNKAAVIESTVKMGPVMIAAGLTATLGFASLALFGVRAVANLGLSCAYGIGSAVLLEMTFIPALRAVLPAPRRSAPVGGWTARVLASIQRAVLRRRGRPVLIGTAVVLALAAVGILRIRTFGPTREYIPADSLARRHLEALERHFPGTVTLTVLYDGAPRSTTSLPVLRHMAALQDEMQRDPLVVRTASEADLVKTLHQIFNSDDPSPYRLPDSQELTSQLLFLGESPAFERFVDRSQSRSVVTAYLRSDDSALVGPLVRHLEAWLAAHPPPPGERVLLAGGVGPTVLAVNEHTTYGKLLNMLVVLAVIYLVSSVIMRSAVVGLYVVTPIVVTMIVLFGTLGWTGVRLDMGSASIIAMAAGVGADYAIYFLFRLREEHRRLPDDAAAVGAALQTSGRAILFVASAIAAGFACMAWSPYLGMELFGTLMPAAMLVSCLAALTLMPVLVLRLRPRFIYADQEASQEQLAVAAGSR
jgi:predicted RND superfamily exporter protein